MNDINGTNKNKLDIYGIEPVLVVQMVGKAGRPNSIITTTVLEHILVRICSVNNFIPMDLWLLSKTVIKNAMTRIRTWVFAATMQSTYHYTITALMETAIY